MLPTASCTVLVTDHSQWLEHVSKELRKLTKHLKRVAQAREALLARLLVKVEELRAELHANAAAGASGLGPSDPNSAEPFVVRKRRRSDEGNAHAGTASSAAGAGAGADELAVKTEAAEP